MRLGWLIGLAALLPGATAQNDGGRPAQNPAVTEGSTTTGIMADTPDARRAADLLNHTGVSLADAIRTAERHARGRALSAEASLIRVESPGKAGRSTVEEQVLFQIGCVTAQGQRVLVTIDGRNGEVRRMRPLSGAAQAGGEGALQPTFLRTKSILNKDVLNIQNREVGKVHDLALDRDGRVAYAVLSFGGFLGMGEKFFAIPWQAIQVRPDHRLALDITSRDELASAAGFDKEHWPLTADRRWVRDGYQLAGHEETGGTLPTFQAKTTDLLGKKATNTQNEELGKLTELVVDANQGRVACAVLSQPGRLIAIPWALVDVYGRETVKIDISAERLARAPSFGRGEETTAVDPAWLAQVYRYFDQDPYWQSADGRPRSGAPDAKPDNQP
jgi:sporulation protein YlmC with PRC-barrel domain